MSQLEDGCVQLLLACTTCGWRWRWLVMSWGSPSAWGSAALILLYHFHRAGKAGLAVTPFLYTEPRGVFATRAPSRPNPIGLSVVRLLSAEEDTLYIENVDIVDRTPLLDIKPYVPKFDHYEGERIGWLASARKKVEETRADNRFGKRGK